MKIGINRWTLPGDLSIGDCFQMAKRTGFDSIEINIAEDGYLTTNSTEAEVRQIVAQAQQAGIELSSLSTGLGWKYQILSPDAQNRQQGLANIRKMLEVAEWMGVDTILVVPGRIDADTPYDDAYDRTLAAMKELAPEAERRKVAIGIENVWNKFLLSPLEFARILDEVGSPYVGAYFDAGNILAYGYPDQWIKILGQRIKKVHVKDFNTSIGNITGFCNPLQGDVPWERVRKALEAVGYDGYITAEVGGYNVHPELGLKHIAESLRAVFG
ncbi:MAG TPA: sugar phosphate isomerase/epimerase family protein [Chthonomonadaceae bacterium]|nr:sugar phosphate isomerase/epimerase family protein [Chthonomonadaceae bacterium]